MRWEKITLNKLKGKWMKSDDGKYLWYELKYIFIVDIQKPIFIDDIN